MADHMIEWDGAAKADASRQNGPVVALPPSPRPTSESLGLNGLERGRVCGTLEQRPVGCSLANRQYIGQMLALVHNVEPTNARQCAYVVVKGRQRFEPFPSVLVRV